MSDPEYIPSDSEFAQDVPPNSVGAEQGVLSCVIQSPSECFETTRLTLDSPDAFYDVRHKIIWRALGDMAGNGGIDLITLGQKLKDRNQIDDIGGLAYLSELSRATPSVSNLPAYLDTVVLKHNMRRIIRMSDEIKAKARNDEGDVDATASFFEYCAKSLLRKSNSLLPPIVSAKELSEKVIPLPFEIVEGVLHQGTKMAIGGGSKASKTWLLMDLAVSIAHGVPWLGFKCFESPVLYLNFEIQEAFMRYRVNKVCEAKGVELGDNFDLWNLRGYDAPFDRILPDIISRIKTRGYSLVILDPIYKLYGKLDENKAGDIALLMNALGRLNVETKASIAFAAHFSKGNQSQKEAIDRISGSGVFARDPDSILTMTAHEEDRCFTVDGTLRNLPPFPPFVIKWDFPLMRNQTYDPSSLKKVGGRPKNYDAEKIALLLAPASLLIGEWIKLAAEELGTSRATFYRALVDLRTSGRVAKLSDSKWSLASSQNQAPSQPKEQL